MFVSDLTLNARRVYWCTKWLHTRPSLFQQNVNNRYRWNERSNDPNKETKTCTKQHLPVAME